MTGAVERVTDFAHLHRDAWELHGRARIDDRPTVAARLLIWRDGTWRAEVAIFTFAGYVDLYFDTPEGGHFCGPAFVEASRASSNYGLSMGTELLGRGPLLVVAPEQAPQLDAPGMVDGEVLE